LKTVKPIINERTCKTNAISRPYDWTITRILTNC